MFDTNAKGKRAYKIRQREMIGDAGFKEKEDRLEEGARSIRKTRQRRRKEVEEEGGLLNSRRQDESRGR